MATLSTEDKNELLAIVESRFHTHMERHLDAVWSDVLTKLETDSNKLIALSEMEKTGGEPDVIRLPNGDLVFCDCSAESPSGRRSLCYDEPALTARKKNKPSGSAVTLAEVMGIALLNEVTYRHLQTLGAFDVKTSSWISTPETIRQKGGALFCDRRYDHIFVYHNGADSYYAARGFRGMFTI
ncbi:DUF4256 domain-containing protein [Exiguobacterium sp. SH3S2]|uniref:DUF4256 domain-containing protein n=1 Tax=unclassified Exiguobacterium TaxID=2644629 RepID=UPI0010400D28|nr:MULTISPECIES: DUF4256 domain-containing protein [unclassified Exiguobacterium]TCI46390.1 DUF4256 domain-containing protein [Exiguobacterium sp. SH3S3]TCI62031.1 DUF4256 domain-containing protein [Exiguobacterium sp. SH3S2]